MSGIGAFFDLDGTLLAAPSVERRFVFYLLMRGLIGPAQFARSAARFVTSIGGNSGAALEANKAHFSGIPTKCAGRWSGHSASHPLQFHSNGFRRLGFHFAQGHSIFLITGAPAPLAELAAGNFSVRPVVIATQLEARDGVWTGEIIGEHICGDAKRRAIVRLAAAHSLDLARSFAYGDSASDLPMLETVGHPVAVNPSRNLERAARARNWPVWHWRERRRGWWRETQGPRVINSRGAVQPLRGLNASLTQSINFRGANR